jgi:hypothetical protein
MTAIVIDVTTNGQTVNLGNSAGNRSDTVTGNGTVTNLTLGNGSDNVTVIVDASVARSKR